MPSALIARLHPKAQQAIQQNLAPGEDVKVVIQGPSNQAIVGTDRRAFIYKKGFMAGATFGSELTSWDYRNLVGVQIHTGMMSGAVVLQAPGQSGKSTKTWGNKDDDPYKAPNAIPINRPYEPAQQGVTTLRQLIGQAHHPAHADPVPRAPSALDELERLARLRESGALSEDEFRAMKARIISGS